MKDDNFKPVESSHLNDQIFIWALCIRRFSQTSRLFSTWELTSNSRSSQKLDGGLAGSVVFWASESPHEGRPCRPHSGNKKSVCLSTMPTLPLFGIFEWSKQTMKWSRWSTFPPFVFLFSRVFVSAFFRFSFTWSPALSARGPKPWAGSAEGVPVFRWGEKDPRLPCHVRGAWGSDRGSKDDPKNSEGRGWKGFRTLKWRNWN